MTDAVENKKSFEQREKRVSDAISLRRPDRVPIMMLSPHYYPTEVAGLSKKEALNNHEKCFEAYKKMTLDLELDMAPFPGSIPPARPYELMGVKQYKWAGDGLGDDVGHQYVEKEYMPADEYDAFLENPEGFAMRTLWPRMVESMAPLAQLPPLYSLLEARHLVMLGGSLAGTPEFSDLLQKMIELGKEVVAYTNALNAYYAEMEAFGFPISYRTIGRAPFEGITDFLRGMKGSMLDMYRVPDKLLAAIDLIAPQMTRYVMTGATKSGNPRVFVPLHRGADGYMSDEQFKKFYWPSLKKMLLDLVEAGLTPMPFFEATYDSRLEYLTELPRGKMAGHFEIVDRKKAKKIIGETMCFWGNVSAQLLVNGTPAQVKDDVKDLIDTFGDNGGLIVDGSVSIPDEANPKNVAAMVETVFDYGVY